MTCSLTCRVGWEVLGGRGQFAWPPACRMASVYPCVNNACGCSRTGGMCALGYRH